VQYRRLGWFPLLALVSFGPAPAAANGRFPETNQLVVEPGSPDHVVVRATFGLLVTRDRGTSWDFVCEEAFGLQNSDPPLALLPGGVMLLALDTGISRSDEQGCTFAPALGIGAGVVDISVALGEPGDVFAVTQDGQLTTFWESTDFGVTFSPTAEPLTDFVAATLDVAPSNPDVVYASGLVGSTGVLLRSADRARSFERFEIPGAGGARVPYLAAIDPEDADIVYVRTYGIPASLLQTRDGGQSFGAPLETALPSQGFALSADGSTIVVSNPFEGTFVGNREGFQFERLRCGGASCLAFAAEDLLGCGSEALDGFVVGVSRDHGASFSRLLALSCVPGPVGCPTNSGVGESCVAAWPRIREQIGAETCSPVDAQSDSSCAEEAGAGGSGGSGGSPDTSSGAAGTSGVDDPPAGSRRGDSAGCGCSFSKRWPPGPSLLLAAAVAAIAFRRRQRATAARSETARSRRSDRGHPGRGSRR
jgi:MYXO-CTERM domain-containing protein